MQQKGKTVNSVCNFEFVTKIAAIQMFEVFLKNKTF